MSIEAKIEGKGERFINMIHRDELVGIIIAALKNGRPGEGGERQIQGQAVTLPAQNNVGLTETLLRSL